MLESSYADVKNFQVYFDSDTNRGFKVLSLYCSGEENGLKNIVKRASWTYTLVDGQYSARVYKDSYFGDPDSHSYTNYEDLKESQVIDWIKGTINLEEMESDLNRQINEAKSSSIVKEKNLPWKYEDKYDMNDKYVMVKDGVVIHGPSQWRSEVINNILEKNGVPGNFPHEIVARQSGLLPIENPLVINENIKIYKVELQNEQPQESIFTDNGHIVWDFSTGIAIGVYVAVDKPIDEIKSNLKRQVENIRADKESDVVVNIRGRSLKIFTGSYVRIFLVEKLKLMNDSDVCNLKFIDDEWETVTKNDIVYILQSINSNIQNALDWDYQISNQIKNSNTVEQLKSINLG